MLRMDTKNLRMDTKKLKMDSLKPGMVFEKITTESEKLKGGCKLFTFPLLRRICNPAE
jgi:hypothetical protein